jgi:hypothetical protein
LYFRIATSVLLEKFLPGISLPILSHVAYIYL